MPANIFFNAFPPAKPLTLALVTAFSHALTTAKKQTTPRVKV